MENQIKNNLRDILAIVLCITVTALLIWLLYILMLFPKLKIAGTIHPIIHPALGRRNLKVLTS